MAKHAEPCAWVGLQEALKAFVLDSEVPQSSRHIKPLHWYVACRLVIEGGFRPDEITPRPPFIIKESGSSTRRRFILSYDEDHGGVGEQAILGGLKTKNVDVVVEKQGIGPCVAVSLKGTLKAFRNLTNRMEEAVGDCANLHISYPALVYGFLHVLKATPSGRDVPANDVAVTQHGDIVESIIRYHDVLVRLAGRDDIRSEPTMYEAIALALVVPHGSKVGTILPTFPPKASSLAIETFFDKLYKTYDQRFVYAAPSLVATTRRLEWDPESPALSNKRASEYHRRVSGGC